MKIEFSKMHGLGNDFVVIDGINQIVNLSAEQIRGISNRHTGIGCDQLLLVEKPQLAGAEFRYRIFNSDGGEVEQCGNGARCFARFVTQNGLTQNTEICVETMSGLIVLRCEANGEVRVNMGIPNFEPSSLPFITEQVSRSYMLELQGAQQHFSVVSMGNPHAVLQVDNIDTAPVNSLGPLLEQHPAFPERVNVGFMQIVSADLIHLRVYERGVGETLACGTGACAAVAAGIYQGKLSETVKVSLPGGELAIRWSGNDQPLFMTGPASQVFKGSILL